MTFDSCLGWPFQTLRLYSFPARDSHYEEESFNNAPVIHNWISWGPDYGLQTTDFLSNICVCVCVLLILYALYFRVWQKSICPRYSAVWPRCIRQALFSVKCTIAVSFPPFIRHRTAPPTLPLSMQGLIDYIAVEYPHRPIPVCSVPPFVLSRGWLTSMFNWKRRRRVEVVCLCGRCRDSNP